MPGTFSQIYIQIVFAVKNRKSLIHPAWEDKLYKYITGIIQNKGQKVFAINGAYDHIHILISIKPSCCLSELVREIKKSSNKYIRENRLSPFRFEWQEGFGAFSYSRSALDNVITYIHRQKEHHAKNSFREEYISFLNRFEIPFEERYLFNWID